MIDERTCTEVRDEARGGPRRPGEVRQAESRPLSEFRDCGAYVLLGAPGAGKTQAFQHEAKKGEFCDARDFLTFCHERWSKVEPLFIDGLDEVRAGLADGRTPLDLIRGKIDRLGRPRFRLSCREADWFGAADRDRLKSVSPDGEVKVLRLDPLSDDDIREILSSKAVEGVDAFIKRASDHGIGGLLSNPQTLILLADAVAGGNWPTTRTATFEAACGKLVREHNQEHCLAGPQPTDSTLLDAAGRLCAVHLLTGRAGYLLSGTTAHGDDCIDLGDIPHPGPEILRAVVHTGLFNAVGGRTMPVHRHIAEFLAGRYLSGLIDKGLPIRRVLALMTGEDGRTVSALRGLAAWLAAHCRHCKAARDEVVERDPLGTVLYGDVRGFSSDDKRRLLDCLERDAERDPQVFAAMHDLDSRWGDLATPDMESQFRQVLNARAGGPGKQTVALAVLESLERGAAIPGLVSMLPEVVRDESCRRELREAALDGWILQCRGAGDTPKALKALLDGLYAGSVSDPRDNLLGRLLWEFYPKTISPAEVGRYLRKPNKEFIGWYACFWQHDVAERSTDEQLAEVLDSLAEPREDGGSSGEGARSSSHWVRTITGELLATCLERYPTVDAERLFAWLGLRKDARHQAKRKIETWFQDNPASYKAVVLVRLAAGRYAESPRVRRELDSRLSLPRANEPPDFGEWCLVQLAQPGTSTKAATDFLLIRVVARQDIEGISDETVEERLAHNPALVAEYRELRQRQNQGAAEFAASSTELEHAEQARQRRKEWRSLVKDNESALRENRAAPALLHRLAATCLERFTDLQTGELRLRDLLGNDDLVDTVIEAFRASPMRADLPDVTEIFRLANEGKEHCLMLPFLVGLGEASSLRLGEAPLDEQGVRRALAFRFHAPGGGNREPGPGWYQTVWTCRPDLVADVLVRSVRAALRRGANSCRGLYELGHDDDHAPVARLAVAPLLKSFPTRCKVEQLNVLKLLLNAAFRHVDHDAFLQIVEDRLALSTTDSAQRLYWLCAGLLTAPSSFTTRLREALAGRGRERRIRHMAEFLCESEPALIAALDVPALELLIASLGNSYRPYGSDDGLAMEADTPRLVSALIDRLSSEPSRDAANALERLSAEVALRPWQPKLQAAAGRQREVRREAEFRHPTVEQALETLENRRPANAADLAALALDVLRDLATEIRNGNTSDWRQHWNVDSRNQPRKPKPENACRDALLSDLKEKLARSGVDAQPEGTYAEDHRADIRVSYSDGNVPVEIKKSDHRDLWTAIRQQLIGKYTRDPGANGYGIYLVFWFGYGHCRQPPTGPVPDSPAALEKRLVAETCLSQVEMRKINVCVIDVSKPDPPK